MEDTLFIKQTAILEVIKEHSLINFDNLHRRFLGINKRTLRYHLKKLQILGLIRKRGFTNGVYYECIK
jgi:repressor of nif and glnA expression